MHGEGEERRRNTRFGRNAGHGAADRGIFGRFLHCLTGGYADFHGRSRRKDYWSFVLIGTALFAIALGVAFWLDDRFSDVYSDGQYVPVYTIVTVAILTLLTIVPGLAVTARRFHDVGLSGWLLLLFAVLSVVGIGILVIVIVMLVPSQMRDNRWGPVPEFPAL